MGEGEGAKDISDKIENEDQLQGAQQKGQEEQQVSPVALAVVKAMLFFASGLSTAGHATTAWPCFAQPQKQDTGAILTRCKRAVSTGVSMLVSFGQGIHAKAELCRSGHARRILQAMHADCYCWYMQPTASQARVLGWVHVTLCVLQDLQPVPGSHCWLWSCTLSLHVTASSGMLH